MQDIPEKETEMKPEAGRLHYAFLTHEHTDHILSMVWAVRYVPDDFDTIELL